MLYLEVQALSKVLKESRQCSSSQDVLYHGNIIIVIIIVAVVDLITLSAGKPSSGPDC